jgi:hypothetical protein
MISATVTGSLVHVREEGPLLVGRIRMEGDKPVQFTARRGIVKRALQALPTGMPVCVAGQLCTSIKRDKAGTFYVLHELAISAVLTTSSQQSLLGAII